MPNTAHPFSGRVIKIYEDTTTGKYAIQIDDAVGTGNQLSKRVFADGQGPDFMLHLKNLLVGTYLLGGER